MCAYALALWYGSLRISAGAYNGGSSSVAAVDWPVLRPCPQCNRERLSWPHAAFFCGAAGDVLNVLFAALIGGFSLGQAAPNFAYFVGGQSAGVMRTCRCCWPAPHNSSLGSNHLNWFLASAASLCVPLMSQARSVAVLPGGSVEPQLWRVCLVGAAARVFAVINRKPLIDEEPDAKTLKSVVGAVELRGVDFAYPARPDTNIFKDFSLAVPAGHTVALVGESGSGALPVAPLPRSLFDARPSAS
jgi:ABC-type multidrug transport system fused ATPase/permease subunit